jgi:hypothetical protein
MLRELLQTVLTCICLAIHMLFILQLLLVPLVYFITNSSDHTTTYRDTPLADWYRYVFVSKGIGGTESVDTV